jgi:hypothetical protein
MGCGLSWAMGPLLMSEAPESNTNGTCQAKFLKLGTRLASAVLDMCCRGVARGPTLTLVVPVEFTFFHCSFMRFFRTWGCCLPGVIVTISWVVALGLELPAAVLFLGGSDPGRFSFVQLWKGCFKMSYLHSGGSFGRLWRVEQLLIRETLLGSGRLRLLAHHRARTPCWPFGVYQKDAWS